MTLVERLLNPAWVSDPNGGDASLDTRQTLAAMKEAAELLARPGHRDRTGGKYAMARALRAQGFTIRAIAKKLGYKSTCSVAAALKAK